MTGATATAPAGTDLFDGERREQVLGPGAVLLGGFARDAAPALADLVDGIAAAAPFRHWETPGGHRMSVAMTCCGRLGWVSDRRGYRYEPADPHTGRPWPALPAAFAALARNAARHAGFAGFVPDACLINRYEAGARLSLHQDRDELDLGAPIVSVSLGAAATFLFGGLRRSDPQRRLPLRHGDVLVWGGPSRLAFHGVLPLKPDRHERLDRHEHGPLRINLTFRKVLG